MLNSTKRKREQRRMDEMVTSVGMPPNWEPIGRDKKGAWFREDEWGRRGKEMVLNGDRAYFDTPIAAIADYQLKGEVEPAKADLADVFGGASWDD